MVYFAREEQYLTLFGLGNNIKRIVFDRYIIGNDQRSGFCRTHQKLAIGRLIIAHVDVYGSFFSYTTTTWRVTFVGKLVYPNKPVWCLVGKNTFVARIVTNLAILGLDVFDTTCPVDISIIQQNVYFNVFSRQYICTVIYRKLVAHLIEHFYFGYNFCISVLKSQII